MMGQRLLRWSVVGVALTWVAFVVLTATSSENERVLADAGLTFLLLVPLPWAYARPGPVSGAVAVAVTWLLGALIVTALLALPFVLVAEVLLLVAWLRRGDRGETPESRTPTLDA